MSDDIKLAYTLQEAMVATGIGKTKLYQIIKNGDLPCKKVGRHTIVLAADLRAFLENLPAMLSGAKP